MYCTCTGSDKSFTAMPKRDDNGDIIPFAFDYDFWVHTKCLKPSRLVFEWETKMHAPASATVLLSSHGKRDGTFINTWAGLDSGSRITTMTFNPYMKRPDMTVDSGRHHLLNIWKKLDDAIDKIRSIPSPVPANHESDKGMALAYADVLSQLMQPFYPERDDVLAESMARWTARQEGREHESPGLGEKYWQPTATTEMRSVGAPVVKAKPRVELDATKIKFIQHSIATGVMDAEALAGMFNVPVEQVQECING